MPAYDTVMGIGDPGRDLAILFLTTDSPNPSGDNTRRFRTTVTNKIVAAFARSPGVRFPDCSADKQILLRLDGLVLSVMGIAFAGH